MCKLRDGLPFWDFRTSVGLNCSSLKPKFSDATPRTQTKALVPMRGLLLDLLIEEEAIRWSYSSWVVTPVPGPSR
jgi:hypothetical protein